MKRIASSFLGAMGCIALLTPGSPVWAVTGVQVGATGKTYASAGLECALHPLSGMSPMIQAGLYNPRKSAKATVSLNGTPIATVTFYNPDSRVWVANQVNTVVVALDRKTADTYVFDASSDQINICIPDTSGNSTNGEIETAASGKSYATVTPGCAFNPRTGHGQRFVNLFDNGAYLLNVSVNNVPLTQLSGMSPTHTPVFLSAGLNVISAVNAALSIDYYVRDGGTGSCTLPQ